MEQSIMKHGRCMGIDFGLRYCGIALGQTLTRNTRPFTILPAKNGAIAMYQLDAIIHSYKIKTIVIGIIDDHVLARMVCSFKQLLRYRHPYLEICLVEEVGTSKEARSLVRSRCQRDDAIAASFILDNWLNDI